MPTVYERERLIHITIKPDEKAKLEELARKQTRTLSGLVRHLINQEYERLQATRQIDSVQQ